MVSICLVSPTAGFALAYVVGDLDDGAAFIDQALVLNPNLAWAWLFSGYAKLWLGEPEEAIQRVARAMRLSPQDFQFFNMQTATAGTHFVAGRYAEALSWAEAAVRSNQNYILPIVWLQQAARLPDAPKKQKEPWLAYANFNLSCASPI
jgi:tetratricopeptide (TPR) repeat protein